jgi:hypothetical protein
MVAAGLEAMVAIGILLLAMPLTGLDRRPAHGFQRTERRRR